MTTCSSAHHDISFEPADSPARDDLDLTADVAETTAYQGRHVRLDVPCIEDPEAAPVNGSHPRRHGFGILSRLARVDAGPEDAADDAPTGAHAALVEA
jgi:hypothetical protein